MIAIHTRYLPPTDTKPGRIKAYTVGHCSFPGMSATVTKIDARGFELEHFEAVKALVKKYNLDWNLDEMRFGDSADGRGYVFCFAQSIVGKG